MIFNHLKSDNFDQNSHQVNDLYLKHVESIKGISIWDLTLFLLWQLKSAGFTPYRITTIDQQRQSWLDALAEMESLVDEKIISQSLKLKPGQNYKLNVILPLNSGFSYYKNNYHL